MSGPLPQGPFSLIYCDPAWKTIMRSEAGMARSPDRHYRTMTLPELAALPVADIAASDSLLVMWVIDTHYPHAMDLGAAWGFTFKTCLFRWLKVRQGKRTFRFRQDAESGRWDIALDARLNFGTGYHTRAGGCEEAWVFSRGRGLPTLRHDIPREFGAPIREHSRKPDSAAADLEALYGDVPRIELFARTRRPGWEAWGAEVGKFAA